MLFIKDDTAVLLFLLLLRTDVLEYFCNDSLSLPNRQNHEKGKVMLFLPRNDRFIAESPSNVVLHLALTPASHPKRHRKPLRMDPFSMAWEKRRNLLPPAAHPKVCAAAFCNSNSVRNQNFLAKQTETQS